MYAQLGNIIFEPLSSFTSFDDSESAIWAEHALVSGKPKLEPTALQARILNISIRLHQNFIDVKEATAKLRSILRNHEVNTLIWGNGDVEGSFVIERIDRIIEDQDSTGNIYSALITLGLKEYDIKDQNEHANAARKADALKKIPEPVLNPRSNKDAGTRKLVNKIMHVLHGAEFLKNFRFTSITDAVNQRLQYEINNITNAINDAYTIASQNGPDTLFNSDFAVAVSDTLYLVNKMALTVPITSLSSYEKARDSFIAGTGTMMKMGYGLVLQIVTRNPQIQYPASTRLGTFKTNVLAAGLTLPDRFYQDYILLGARKRDTATAILLPGVYNTGNIYAMGKFGELYSMSHTRAGTATRVKQDGTIELVSAGVPRMSYDYASGRPYYSIESSVTNYWGGSNPYESQSGSFTTDSVNGAISSIYPGNSVREQTGVSSSYGACKEYGLGLSTYTFSVFVKKRGTGTFASLLNTLDPFGVNLYTTYFFDTGVIEVRDIYTLISYGGNIGSNVLNIRAKSKLYGNGWVRISVTYTINNASANHTIVGTSPKRYTSSGGATQYSGFYATCPQYEAGELSSYIPTPSGTQVTRVADTLNITGLQAKGVFGEDSGTIVFEGNTSANSKISIQDSTSTEILQLKGNSFVNVPESLTTSSGTILNKGAWRWELANKDSFCNDGTLVKNASNSILAKTSDKAVLVPSGSMQIYNLVFSKNAVVDSDMITMTT